MKRTFKIRHVKGNKDGSLPDHWDILIAENEESLITVWDSHEMAEQIVAGLERYATQAVTLKEDSFGYPEARSA